VIPETLHAVHRSGNCEDVHKDAEIKPKLVLEGGVEPPRSFGAPDFESVSEPLALGRNKMQVDEITQCWQGF